MTDQLSLPPLTAARRADAHERFALLRPHLEEGVPLTRVAADHGVPLRTIQRWLARYRRDGMAGLARRFRADRGQRHLPSDLIGLIEGLALRKPPPTVAAVQRQVVTVAEREGWPPPSYSTVYAIVERQLTLLAARISFAGSRTPSSLPYPSS